MGSLINFPGLQTPTPWVLPSVYTPERIECLGRANAVARQLRDLGYRIVVEIPVPDGEGPAIIQVDVSAIGTRPLRLLGGCTIRNTRTGIEGTTIDDVLVLWRIVGHPDGTEATAAQHAVMDDRRLGASPPAGRYRPADDERPFPQRRDR